jgi:Fe-S cluster assembly scaffold protein SufB
MATKEAKTLGNRAFASDFVNPLRGTTSRSLRSCSATGCAPLRRRAEAAGVRCPLELSTYFRINAANTGQFERTLIVAEKGSYEAGGVA